MRPTNPASIFFIIVLIAERREPFPLAAHARRNKLLVRKSHFGNSSNFNPEIATKHFVLVCNRLCVLRRIRALVNSVNEIRPVLRAVSAEAWNFKINLPSVGRVVF